MKRFFSATCDVFAMVWLWNFITGAAGAVVDVVVHVVGSGD